MKQDKDLLQEIKEQKIPEKTNEYREKIRIASIIIAVIICILTAIAFYKGYFVDQTKFSNLLSRFGIFAPVIFIIIQTILTVFPVNPSAITNLSVVIAYGPIIGFILNYIAIMLGSVINFQLGRKYGKKFLGLLFNDETINKQIDWLNKNNNIEKMFIIVLVVPFLPDDISCMICGMTNFKFKRFFWIIAFFKLWALAIFLYIMMFGYESLYKILF